MIALAAAGPGYSCPKCGRNALGEAEDELADYECGVCGNRVREVAE